MGKIILTGEVETEHGEKWELSDIKSYYETFFKLKCGLPRHRRWYGQKQKQEESGEPNILGEVAKKAKYREVHLQRYPINALKNDSGLVDS